MSLEGGDRQLCSQRTLRAKPSARVTTSTFGVSTDFASFGKSFRGRGRWVRKRKRTRCATFRSLRSINELGVLPPTAPSLRCGQRGCHGVQGRRGRAGGLETCQSRSTWMLQKTPWARARKQRTLIRPSLGGQKPKFVLSDAIPSPHPPRSLEVPPHVLTASSQGERGLIPSQRPCFLTPSPRGQECNV